VKSSAVGAAASPSATELGRLKARATKIRATAVVVYVDSDGTMTFESARDGRKLSPPDTRAS